MRIRLSLPTLPWARLALPLLLAVVGPVVADAQNPDRLAPGPPHQTLLELGQWPPSTFTLESTDGELHDLAAMRGERPVMLLVLPRHLVTVLPRATRAAA